MDFIYAWAFKRNFWENEIISYCGTERVKIRYVQVKWTLNSPMWCLIFHTLLWDLSKGTYNKIYFQIFLTLFVKNEEDIEIMTSSWVFIAELNV